MVQTVYCKSEMLYVTPNLVAGAPLVLLPALTPAYYMGILKGGTAVSPELWYSLEGHGYVRQDSEELVVCWLPIPRSDDQDAVSDQGVCCVWPLSLCMVSTSRGANENLPLLNLTTLPISKIVNPQSRLAGNKSNSPNVIIASNSSDIDHAVKRANRYTDAVVRNRERARDIQRVPDASRPLPASPLDPANVLQYGNGIVPAATAFHQLYPSPPGTSPDSSRADQGSFQMSTMREPTSDVAPSLLSPSDEGPFNPPPQARQWGQSPHQTEEVPFPKSSSSHSGAREGGMDEMRWPVPFDLGNELDDFALITDDVFNFFDSPPSGNASIEALAITSNTVNPELPINAISISDSPLSPSPTSSHSQLSREDLSPPNSSRLVSARSYHFFTGNKDDFSAISIGATMTDVRPPTQEHIIADGESASLQSRYTNISDPRTQVLYQLRTLKANNIPNHSVTLSGESSGNSPHYKLKTLDEDKRAESSVNSNISTPSTVDTWTPPVNTDALFPSVPNVDIFPEATLFALFTQRSFDPSWFPLQNPTQISSIVNLEQLSNPLSGQRRQDSMYILSIPTPVSPGELVTESEYEEFLRIIIPSFTSDCVEGGLWPYKRCRDFRHAGEVPTGFGRIFKPLVGSPVDLASIAPLLRKVDAIPFSTGMLTFL